MSLESSQWRLFSVFTGNSWQGVPNEGQCSPKLNPSAVEDLLSYE